MPGRESWGENYWRRLDKETARKLRTTCPRCGSTNTYYNPQYKTWRCARCEHSFVVKGVKGADGAGHWWKRLQFWRRR